MQTVVQQCQLQPTVGSTTGTATARTTGASTSKQPLASRVSTTKAGAAASASGKLEGWGISGMLSLGLGCAVAFLL